MNLQSSDILLTDNIDEVVSLVSDPDNYVILLYCTSGRITVDLNGREVAVRKNDFLVCGYSMLMGDYMRSSDFGCMAICVSARSFEQVAIECFRGEPRWLEKQRYIKENPVFQLNDFQLNLMQSYASLIAVYLQGVQDGYRQTIIRYLTQAATLEILSFLDTAVGEDVPEENLPVSKSGLLVLRFLEVLRKNFGQKKDVNWYAEQLCVTPKYLSRVCKQHSSRTASAWIDEVTIEEVRRLLLRTDMSIKEVAFACGFSNVSFFCQYVKHHTGKTPSQLRKNNAE